MTTTHVAVTQADAKHEYVVTASTKVCALGAALNANDNFEELFTLEGMDMDTLELVLASGARVRLKDLIVHGDGGEVVTCECCALSQLAGGSSGCKGGAAPPTSGCSGLGQRSHR